jgi:hypothetical protein
MWVKGKSIAPCGGPRVFDYPSGHGGGLPRRGASGCCQLELEHRWESSSPQPVATTADFEGSLGWNHGTGNTVVCLLDRGDLATEDDDFGHKPSRTLIVPPGLASGLAGSLFKRRLAAFLEQI